MTQANKAKYRNGFSKTTSINSISPHKPAKCGFFHFRTFMTVESASYVGQLNPNYPATGDPKSEGDDHLRLIKTALTASFPNVAGPVSATHSTLNLVGVTQPTTDNSTAPASTAFVNNKILAATLTPAQAQGNTVFLAVNFGAL